MPYVKRTYETPGVDITLEAESYPATGDFVLVKLASKSDGNSSATRVKVPREVLVWFASSVVDHWGKP